MIFLNLFRKHAFNNDISTEPVRDDSVICLREFILEFRWSVAFLNILKIFAKSERIFVNSIDIPNRRFPPG
jgi:hypothetical protein